MNMLRHQSSCVTSAIDRRNLFRGASIQDLILSGIAHTSQPQAVFSVFILIASSCAEEPEPQETENPIVRILSFRNEQNIDGSYKFEYESEDGSKRFEQGYYKNAENSEDGKAQVIEGSYSYMDPNGEQVNIQYIADENGFRPQGNIIHPAISSYLQNLQVESVKNPPVQPEESARKV